MIVNVIVPSVLIVIMASIQMKVSVIMEHGKFQKEDERTEDTRMLLMGRITHELVQFKKHNDHVEWWKNVWPEMKDKLNSDQIIIRWDFIGIFIFQQKKILTKPPTPIPENYVHEDSYAMSSSHFGKKQSTL